MQEGGTITVTAHTDLIGDIAATMTISVGGSGTRTPMIKGKLQIETRNLNAKLAGLI